MKQHRRCTWQGHPWLAISTVVAAENRPKDDVVSCRVCFVSVDIVGGICGPNLMKDWEAVVSRWVCGFMLGLERILWCFSCCFVSGLCLGCLVHWNSLLWKRQNTKGFLCGLSHGVDWAKYVVSCRVSCRVCGCPIDNTWCFRVCPYHHSGCWTVLRSSRGIAKTRWCALSLLVSATEPCSGYWGYP